MRLVSACVVAAVALLPIAEAVPASAGVSVGINIGGPARGHYYYGHRYYPYRWNGGYYSYYNGGRYYRNRYWCDRSHRRWCYR
jgi:hypothetical protein